MDDVRTAAASAMPDLLNSTLLAHKASNPQASDAFVGQLKDFIYQPLLEQLRKEPDTETLAMLLDSWSEVIEYGGEVPASRLTAAQLTDSVQVAQELIRESLERRAARAKEQEEEDDEDEEGELEAEAEREEILIQNLVECLGHLLKVYGSTLLPLFDAQLLPLFSTMLAPTAIATDRVAALCIYDDIIEHCSGDGGSARYVQALTPQLLMYAVDPTAEVRQAAVYGLGVLAQCEMTGAFDANTMRMAAERLLQVVEDPVAFSEEHASASDNAVSALGKLCKRSEEVGAAALPRWLATLPLQTDKEEARAVHKLLVELVEGTSTALLGAGMERVADVVVVFGQVLGTELVDDDVGARIGALLKKIHSGLPHVLQALPSHPGFAKLSNEQKAALEAAISS